MDVEETFSPKPSKSSLIRLLVLVLLCGVFVQYFSRYVAAPVGGLVLDDWTNLKASIHHESPREILRESLVHDTRPVTVSIVRLAFYFFKDNLQVYNLLSIIGSSLVVLVFGGMVWLLSARLSVVLASLLVFSMIPILTETSYFPTMALSGVCSSFITYGLCMLFGIAHIRYGKHRWLVAALLCYVISVFSYESGAFLPAAFIFLLRPQQWKKLMVYGFSFGLIFAFYLLWRFTSSFGMTTPKVLPAHMDAQFSLMQLVYNLKLIINWWVLENAWTAVAGGFQAFFEQPLWRARIFLVLNVLSAGGVIWFWSALRRREQKQVPSAPFTVLQQFLFTLTWIIVGHAPCLISYVGPRLLYIPALGVALLLALLLNLAVFNRRMSYGLLGFLLLLSLMVNQGTSKNWYDAGVVHTRLYEYFTKHRDEWVDKPIVVIKTGGIAQRITPGILAPADNTSPRISAYRSVPYIRGFALMGLVHVVKNGSPHPRVFLDGERNLVYTDTELIWPERADPSKTHTVPLRDCYIVDGYEVLSGRVD